MKDELETVSEEQLDEVLGALWEEIHPPTTQGPNPGDLGWEGFDFGSG
jgi:hypothetical protein